MNAMILDHNTILRVAAYARKAKTVIGTIDPARLARDTEYAHDIFSRVDATGDQELVSMGLKLRDDLQINVIEHVSPSKDTDTQTAKYLFGARS